jgi:hypothetical protein
MLGIATVAAAKPPGNCLRVSSVIFISPCPVSVIRLLQSQALLTDQA